MSPLEITIYCDKSNSRNVIRKIGFKDELWMDKMKTGTSIDFIEKRYVFELQTKLDVAKNALKLIAETNHGKDCDHDSADTARQALKEME